MKRILAAIAVFTCVPAAAVAQAPCSEGFHVVTRTPRLGLQFVQAGAPALLCLSNSTSAPLALVTVTLKRTPFEIQTPTTLWRKKDKDPDMRISVSDQPGLETKLILGVGEDESGLFGIYHAMADHEFGSGSLTTAEDELPANARTEYGFNSIIGGRFTVSTPDYRGVFVSRIERRFKDDEDLMKANAPVTMIFYFDKRDAAYLDPRDGKLKAMTKDKYGKHDVIATTEIDLVRVQFVD